MAKKKQFNNKIIIFFVAFLFIALGVVFLVKAFYISKKTYHSDFLKITIDYPGDFELKERFGTISLNNNKGEITIGMNATNYKTIDEYLINLSRLNHFTVTSKEKVQLQYELATVVTINNEKKDYFFYPTEWSVYIISASSPALYSELDSIAESFRYQQ